MSVFLLLNLFFTTNAIDKLPLIDGELSDTDYVWHWLEGNTVGNQPSSPQPGTTGPESAYPGSRSGAAVWSDTKGQTWLYGGRGYDRHIHEDARLLNDLWHYDALTGLWSSVWDGLSSGPTPQEHAALCGVEGVLLVLHGTGNESGTWLYDLQDPGWLALKTDVTPVGTTVVWCTRDELIVVASGRCPHHNCTLGSSQSIWALSLRDVVWRRLLDHVEEVGLTSTQWGAPVWAHKATLYLYAGLEACRLWMYHLNNDSFSSLRSDCHLAPPARTFTATWATRQALWMFGGMWLQEPSSSSSTGHPVTQFSHDLWQFDLQSSTWKLIQPESDPSSAQPTQDTPERPGPRSASQAWFHNTQLYLLGGLGQDARNKTCYLNDFWMLNNDSSSLFAAAQAWLFRLPPHSIFLLILATFGGIVLTFGTAFCVRKMLEKPRYSTGDFTIKYSPLSQEASIDM